MQKIYANAEAALEGLLFDGMTIAWQDNVTTISGMVSDQTALHDLLVRVRDYGLVLISIKSTERI